MSIEPEKRRADRKDLAQALRELRRAAGLSGERLAARCAMSQAKISRIETGKIIATVVDVERILRGLEVPADVGREILDLARVANVDYVSARSLARLGTWRRQLELKSLIEASTVSRQFLPAIPSGLIQTRDYAAHAMSPMVPGTPEFDVSKAVDARMELRTVIDDESKSFILLMTEQAVRWNRGGREIMAAQVAHMIQAAWRSNVEVAVIPLSAEVRGTPVNIFVVHDERLVTVELFNGSLSFRDPRDVSYYLEIFELFLGYALTGDSAIKLLQNIADDFM